MILSFAVQKLQLGLGDRTQRNMPCLVPGMQDKVCVFGACGKHHTVVVTDDGKSFSWGHNAMGQTGTCEVKLWIRVPLLPSAHHVLGIFAWM